MCGVVGIAGSSDVNLELYDALTILQHRGQDAAGMVTDSNGELHQCKGEGLVETFFVAVICCVLEGVLAWDIADIPLQAVLAQQWLSRYM